MNERIQELAKQAMWSKTDYSQENELYSFSRDELEKFAELLIRDCGQWFNNRLVVEPDYGLPHRIERNQAVVGVMKEFKEHFGVKE